MFTKCVMPALFLTSICLLIFPELAAAAAAAAAASMVVKGEVGGNISINCPSTANKTIQFFYFQKENVVDELKFVNGFYIGKVIDKPYPNTSLDPEKQTTVHMSDLRVDHNGRYTCTTDYIDQQPGEKSQEEIFVDIEVTANYSKPSVTSTSCSDCNHTVTCESHGGYPQSKLQWSVSEDSVLDDNPTNATSDLRGQFSLSTTATVSCSRGEVSVSCMVNGLTSDKVIVCQSAEASKTHLWLIPLLVVLAVAVVAVAPVVLVRRRRGSGSDSGVENAAVKYKAANGQDPSGSGEKVTVNP
ncbi:uncharacterized protein LOC142903928 isoform X2 [Nelusetta ayraudi]